MNAPKKILSGMLYTLSGTYLGRLYGFVASTILLPRLVDAEAMGGVAFGAALFLVLINVKELGLSYALLHHQDRLEELAPMHFLLYLLASTVWISFLVLASFFIYDLLQSPSLLSRFLPEGNFGDSQIALWAVVCFSCFNLLRSASYTSETLLRAKLEFKALALIHMSGLILSLSVAVLLAWKGLGEWALIIGGAAHYVTYTPVYVLFTVALLWKIQPQPLKNLTWNWDHARLLWQYGKWFWSGGLLYYFIIESPKLIAGYALGKAELGYYVVAYIWAQLTTGAITHILMNLTNPVYARYQKDRQRLSLVFGKMLRLITRIAVLLSLVFYLEADRLIALSGPAWSQSAELLRWLVIYALFHPFLEDIQALMLAVGVPKIIAKINGIQAIFTAIANISLCLRWGIKGIALGTGLTAMLGTLLSFFYVSRYVDISWNKVIVKPILAASTALALLTGFSQYLPGTGIGALAVRSAAIASIYAIGLLVLERSELWQEFQGLKRILREKDEIA